MQMALAALEVAEHDQQHQVLLELQLVPSQVRLLPQEPLAIASEHPTRTVLLAAAVALEALAERHCYWW